MAIGELIGAVVGVMLLIYVAYVLVGSVILTAETVTSAQSDMGHLQEERMRTMINLSVYQVVGTTVYLNVTNTGDEPISDLSHMDVIASDGTSEPTYHHNSDGAVSSSPWQIESIQPDYVHPGQLDPGEVLTLSVTETQRPIWAQVITPNGVYSTVLV
jgi:archaeal flagellar protein FlaF